MKLDFDQENASLTISGYSAAGIAVGSEVIAEPFVLCGDEILTNILPAKFADITAAHIGELVAFERTIIIIGTGPKQALLDGNVLLPALEASVGVEVMNTAAACRSYNVLVGENRAVLGAFYQP